MDDNKGFIKLSRNFLEWGWYDDFSMCRLWIYILLSCNFEDKKWHEYDVPAGSFITSISHLSENTGLSRKAVRRCLEALEKTEEIERIVRNSKHTQIIVNNWKKYQGKTTSGTFEPTKGNSKGTTKGNSKGNSKGTTQGDTTKEIKKERNKEVKNTSTTEDRSKIIEALYYKTPEELERSRKVAEYLKRQEEKEKKC